MNIELIVVIAIAIVAAVWLIRRYIRGCKAKSCGCSCGDNGNSCGSDKKP